MSHKKTFDTKRDFQRRITCGNNYNISEHMKTFLRYLFILISFSPIAAKLCNYTA
jgi:hypothetical protein